MIISSTKTKKPKFRDKIQNIIDGGESKFKSIYNLLKNNLKEELTNKLISRLFSIVEKQKKQIEEYKQEISTLKNNLVYILKRIILSKNKENNNFTSFNKMQNYNTYLKNNSAKTNNTTTITYTSFSPKNRSSSNLKLFTSFLNKTEIDKNYNLTSKNAMHISFKKQQPDIGIKINNYINSLNRKNHYHNKTNINEYYSLNKTQNIYDEIFEKIRIKSIKKSSSPYNSNNISKRNISFSIKKRHYNGLNKSKNENNSKINSFYFEDISNSKINLEKVNKNHLKIKKKKSEISLNRKKRLNNSTCFKNDSKRSKEKLNKKIFNMGLKKKMNGVEHFISLKRSPFIANKI